MNITTNFLQELFKLCLYKSSVIEVCQQHLKYHYIHSENGEYKQVLKDIVTYYSNNNKIPTIGVLSELSYNQKNQKDIDRVQKLLKEIKETKLPDTEATLKQLEAFIKKARFHEVYEKSAELYNNKDHDDAIEYLAKESNEINNFSISKNTSKFEKLFANFSDRQKQRESDKLEVERPAKIPFGISELDSITHGGAEAGDIDLFIAMSGYGRTTWLMHRAIAAARRGFPVLHISAEETKEKVLRKYDTAWTALSLRDVISCNISKELEAQLQKVITDINNKKSDVSIVCFEQFDAVTMKDVRDIVVDYIKVHGFAPSLLVLDYLEKFNPGDGKRYSPTTEGEKYRRQAVADKMKNIASEFSKMGLRIATAMQTGDIAPEMYNKPEFKITRHNASGDKNIVNPFTSVFTWNVTNDENKNKTGRIYVDKLREWESRQTVHIATSFSTGKFYNHQRTIQLFGEE